MVSTPVIEDIPHVALDVMENHEETTTSKNENEHRLRIIMKKKLDKVPGEPLEDRPVTIFRVPAWFHETNKHLWQPKMVSIGPYHLDNNNFRGMQQHKWFTLRDFLARKKVTLEVCLRKMIALEAQARQCYTETVNLSSEDFIMMLVLDGCFILEWFSKYKKNEVDSICDVGWEVIMVDFLLLENQIPFFVIETLFFIQDEESHRCEVVNCPLLELIQSAVERVSSAPVGNPKMSCTSIQHLLHHHYKALMVNVEQMSRPDGDKSEEDHEVYRISCVSELNEAGVKFRKKKDPDHMVDISFEHGIMEIPVLKISDEFSVTLWNMVAFERSQQYTFKQILSAYVELMDTLVNTEKDVAVLERCGIVDNYFPTGEGAAAFYNQFLQHFALRRRDDFFRPVYKKIKAYSDSTWHKYRAKLMHDYFSNPWSVISVGAATFLLGLSAAQTIFSAK